MQQCAGTVKEPSLELGSLATKYGSDEFVEINASAGRPGSSDFDGLSKCR
jgi:hypothetical protein